MRGILFRIEAACSGYENLDASDVPDGVVDVDDYIRGAADAARAIRSSLLGDQ